MSKHSTYATIAETLSNKKEFSKHDIVCQVMNEQHVKNLYENYSRILVKLNDVIDSHHLANGNYADENYKGYNSLQVVTFKRELKDEMKKMDFDKVHYVNLDKQLRYLGNDFEKNTIYTPWLINYIIKALNLPMDQHTKDSITKQMNRVMIKYYGHIVTTSFTAARAYSFIVALKPFLADHNNITVPDKRSFTYRKACTDIAEAVGIYPGKEFRDAFDLVNLNKYGKHQTERYSYNNNPTYLTDYEIEGLTAWAKEYKLQLPKKSTTKPTNHNDKAKAHDEQPIIKDTTKPKAVVKPEVKADVINDNNEPVKYKIPANERHFVLKPDHATKEKPMLAKSDSDMFQSVVDTNQAKSKDHDSAKLALWQTEDKTVLADDPFSSSVQVNTLLKRFLFDKYEIDSESWKADQDALNALDKNSQAYANIKKRLMHPEYNYVTLKK